MASRMHANGNSSRLKKLFIESRGNLIAAAAQLNETSCGSTDDGGYFTSSFFASLNKETSQLQNGEPSWDTIIKGSIESARYKTQYLRGCGTQNGIYSSDMK